MFDALRNSTRVQSKDVSEQLDELRASALFASCVQIVGDEDPTSSEKA